ncbi:MAG: DUF3467 domain-containing protein [Anaerolineae bacterium]|jgi:hypothetical protein|nr:DUF3467 domain-containing protein [Anaerolineae bacterium]MBT7069495.1 DUF3467 domain-containing protein [Anaerolineae bacterium]MBT7324885.1 DUF3467 domain-containing protein [Anaerolineae bacterium]
MSQPKPKQIKQIAMEVDPDIESIYANLARIAHSPADIVLEFAHLLPGSQKAKISSRIVMTPMSAKLLLKALSDNLARYETAFGEIKMPKSNTLADNLFRPFLSPDQEGKDEKKDE